MREAHYLLSCNIKVKLRGSLSQLLRGTSLKHGAEEKLPSTNMYLTIIFVFNMFSASVFRF
jgi:hypothetical protein